MTDTEGRSSGPCRQIPGLEKDSSKRRQNELGDDVATHLYHLPNSRAMSGMFPGSSPSYRSCHRSWLAAAVVSLSSYVFATSLWVEVEPCWVLLLPKNGFSLIMD